MIVTNENHHRRTLRRLFAATAIPNARLRITRHARTSAQPDRTAHRLGRAEPAWTTRKFSARIRAEHLARLNEPEDFDADTPFYENIAGFARASVAAALDALKAARDGENVFSLMRPPGHHATRDRAMGFCYLNNIAIAVLEAAATGAKRVAVFDFDVHHGNGTEAILLNRPGVAFFSIHLYPFYPGTGGANAGKNCFNYPVAPGAPREDLPRRARPRAGRFEKFPARPRRRVRRIRRLRARSRWPKARCVADDFYWLGQSLRALGVPLFSLLEGGYSRDLPELIFAYLKGVEGK